MNNESMMYEGMSSLASDQFSNSNDYFVGRPNDMQAGGDSPNSSNSSSPQQPQGNRARSVSLNLKSPHGRSTAHITQQQINKKRQRATPEQLIVLEESFGMNPNPNAKMREQISNEINMTERSVQIWFQNRRAKTKLLHRKGGIEDQGYPPSPYGFRPGMPMRSYSIDQGMPGDYTNDPSANGHLLPRTVITRLNCRSLTIGSWRRVSCTAMDLVCYFSQNEPKFTYYINSGSSGFKIEFTIGKIGKIDLRYVNSDGPKELGRALITLIESPMFFMEAPIAGGWKQCTDFTENQQASKEMTHAIVGPYEQLKASLTELASIHTETTSIMTFEDIQDTSTQMMNMTFEQPMPTLPQQRSMAFNSGFITPDPRPRPNPSSASTLDIPNNVPKNMHRRTRSRSAPIALDFSQMIGHGNVGGMPGYSFGQQSLRIDPNYHYHHHLGPQSTTSSTPFEYPETIVHTPTTAATPTYQDPWYSASYTNTPLLDGPGSTLTSPMIPAPSHFDTSHNGFQHAYTNGYTASPQQDGMTDGHRMASNHSMPDLQQLNGVQEMANMTHHFSAVDSEMHGLATPLAYPSMAPLSIEDMDFGELHSSQIRESDHTMG